MAEEFDITYQIDDGYAGPSAPHHTTIDDTWFESDTPEQDLKNMFWEQIEDDMRQSVHAVCEQEDEFLAWAKAKQVEKKAAEDA